MWVDAKAIAAASGLTKQWINRRAREGQWESRKAIGRGGPRSEFRVSNLPADLARRFVERQNSDEGNLNQPPVVIRHVFEQCANVDLIAVRDSIDAIRKDVGFIATILAATFLTLSINR
jgi:hypothetical protein